MTNPDLTTRARAVLAGLVLNAVERSLVIVAAHGHPIIADANSGRLLSAGLVAWDLDTAYAWSTPVDLQRITDLGREAARLLSEGGVRHDRVVV